MSFYSELLSGEGVPSIIYDLMCKRQERVGGAGRRSAVEAHPERPDTVFHSHHRALRLPALRLPAGSATDTVLPLPVDSVLGSDAKVPQPVRDPGLLRHAVLLACGPAHQFPHVHHAHGEHARAALRVRQRDAHEPRVQQMRCAGLRQHRHHLAAEVGVPTRAEA